MLDYRPILAYSLNRRHNGRHRASGSGHQEKIMKQHGKVHNAKDLAKMRFSAQIIVFQSSEKPGGGCVIVDTQNFAESGYLEEFSIGEMDGMAKDAIKKIEDRLGIKAPLQVTFMDSSSVDGFHWSRNLSAPIQNLKKIGDRL